MWKYAHVTDYLAYVRPRLDAIRAGQYADDVDARIWYRKFIKALHTRITLKVAIAQGRKHADGYLERLGQFTRRDGWQSRQNKIDAGYLRQFAARGASCLDY